MVESVSGLITDIQHFSIHDGPGIRTTVFLKGCPLKCRWCQNPEAIDSEIEIAYHAKRCIGCGKCLEVCPVPGAIAFEPTISGTFFRCSTSCLTFP